MRLIQAPGTTRRWDFTEPAFQKIKIVGTVIQHNAGYHVEARIIGEYNIARSDPPYHVDETVTFKTLDLESVPNKTRMKINGLIGELDRRHSVLQKVVLEVKWDEETDVKGSSEVRTVTLNNYIINYITVPPDVSREELITLGMFSLPECYTRSEYYGAPMVPQSRLLLIATAISNALRQSDERDQEFEDDILKKSFMRYGGECAKGVFPK